MTETLPDAPAPSHFVDYLSEMPMPASYPDWPSGPQVQAYLDSYVDRFDLRRHINVNTEVIEAVQDDTSKRWTVTTRPCDGNRRPLLGAATTSKTFDILLVCNGTFSDGMVPDYTGLAEFTEAGGKLVHTSDFLDAEEARGKNVIIVGYGKSACDSAVALSQIAASTVSLVMRSMLDASKMLTECTLIDRGRAEAHLEAAQVHRRTVLLLSVPGVSGLARPRHTPCPS